MVNDYGDVIGASPHAFRYNESWLFKCYVPIGVLTAGIVSLSVALGLVVLIGATAGVPGRLPTLLRSFYVLVGLFVVTLSVAPIPFVARRHRHTGSKPRCDLSLVLADFALILLVYAGLLASVPVELWTPAEPFTMGPMTVSALVPVVRLLYGLPALYDFVPPVTYTAGIYEIRRLLR